MCWLGVLKSSDDGMAFASMKEPIFTSNDSPDASFILDGFPRTSSQASQLDALVPINLVVNISTPISIIIDRIANRWVHAPSGRNYNTTFERMMTRKPGKIVSGSLTRPVNPYLIITTDWAFSGRSGVTAVTRYRQNCLRNLVKDSERTEYLHHLDLIEVFSSAFSFGLA